MRVVCLFMRFMFIHEMKFFAAEDERNRRDHPTIIPVGGSGGASGQDLQKSGTSRTPARRADADPANAGRR